MVNSNQGDRLLDKSSLHFRPDKRAGRASCRIGFQSNQQYELPAAFLDKIRRWKGFRSP